MNKRGNVLTFNQKRCLKNEENVPIGIIRHFHKQLNMLKISRTTPISVIISNLNIPWNANVIRHRKDIRMVHTSKLKFIKWSNNDYYYLTMSEPDKCNIALKPHLPWSPEAIERLNVKKFCEDHLMAVIKKFPNLNWKWNPATAKMTLNDIIKYPDYPWNIVMINNKLIVKIDNNESVINELTSLSPKLVIWENITNRMTWKMIASRPNLPWDFSSKNFCKCGEECTGDSYVDNTNVNFFKILKDKPLNWKQITRSASYEIIYMNPEIPWSNKELVLHDDPPIWFIKEFNHLDWNMKDITKKIEKWATILNHHEIKWDFEDRVNNPQDYTITPMSILKRYKHLKWNWDYYSKEYTFYTIKNYPTFPWNWTIVQSRDNIPFDFAMTFPNICWIYEQINCGTNKERRNHIMSLVSSKKVFSNDVSSIIIRLLSGHS